MKGISESENGDGLMEVVGGKQQTFCSHRKLRVLHVFNLIDMDIHVQISVIFCDVLKLGTCTLTPKYC